MVEYNFSAILHHYTQQECSTYAFFIVQVEQDQQNVSKLLCFLHLYLILARASFVGTED